MLKLSFATDDSIWILNAFAAYPFNPFALCSLCLGGEHSFWQSWRHHTFVVKTAIFSRVPAMQLQDLQSGGSLLCSRHLGVNSAAGLSISAVQFCHTGGASRPFRRSHRRQWCHQRQRTAGFGDIKIGRPRQRRYKITNLAAAAAAATKRNKA